MHRWTSLSCGKFVSCLLAVTLFLILVLFPTAVSAENEEDRSAYEAITGQNNAEDESVPDSDENNHAEREDQESNVRQEDTSSQVSANEENRPRSGFLLLLQILFSLIVVLGLIYALVRFLSSRQRKIGHHHLFQNLGGTSLGANKSLQLIKVGGKIYLIGVGDQVNLIKEISEPDELARIEEDLAEQESVLTTNIFSFLRAKWKQWQDPDGAEQKSDGDQASFQSLFRQSLEHHRQNREQAENRLTSAPELRSAGEQTEEGRYR